MPAGYALSLCYDDEPRTPIARRLDGWGSFAETYVVSYPRL
jgi:hypothetical protein